MANNWNLGLVGHLDGTKSKNQLNQDIHALKKVLNSVELKATLDQNQVKNLENQLNKLQVSLTDVTIPQSVLNGLVTQINNALQGIQIPNIDFNPSGVGNAGRQIGEIISKEATNAIGDVTSKVIGQGFTVSPKMSQKVQSELENIVKDWTNGKGKISSITIDTKTDFNEQTLENIEHLKSATVQYSNELGQVITKTLKYKQIGINTFANGKTEAIKGWVESASTYKATLESTSKSTNNFVNQQKKAVTDLTNQVNQIYKSAIDPNASKPIKNSGNLSNLENQYNDIITAIGKMGSASEATFTDERNSINTLISDLKIVVREYKNAETAATSMRSKDVGTVKSIKTNELDEFIAKIQNSKVPMKEMKSEIASLKKSLSNITDTDSLTAYLNQFDIASSKFKSLKEQFANNGSIANVIFDPTELDKQGRIYVKKVNNTIEKTKSEIESKLRNDKKNRWTDIEITGIEKANGQIKSLTVQATNASGAFKELRFEAQKISTNSKKGYQTGLVQTSEVKTLKGNMSQMRQTIQSTLDGLKSKWQEQGVLVGEFKTKVEQLQTSLASVGSKGELNNLKSQIESLKTQASQIAEVNKIQLLWEDSTYEAKYDSLIAKTRQWVNANDESVISTQKLTTAYNEFNTAASNFAKDGSVKNRDILLQKEEELGRQLKATTNDIKVQNAEFAKSSKVDSLHQKIQEFYDKNTATHRTWGSQLKNMLNETAHGAQITATRVNEIEQEFLGVSNAARQAGKLGQSFFGGIKEQASKFIGWFSVTSVVMEGVQSIKKMAQAVIEVDTAMIELTKVSSASSNELKNYFDEAAESAKKLGASVSDVISATADFSRLGYNLKDASVLAEVATLYKNVGDGITIDEASSSIVSTMKAFGIEAENAMQIIDAFNQVGNNFAISSGEIGDALKRSASSLAVGGNSLSEAIGLITAGNTVVQDADIVGTALKSMSLRITSTSAELEAMGEDTEFACETLSDYRDLVMGLTDNKVNIVGDDGEYKSTYEILKDISQVWNDMNSMEQSSLMKALFGVRQANIGASILENFDVAEQAMKSAEESAGSALKEQSNYEKGVQFSLDRLSASWQEFSNHFLDSSFVKGIVDFGNTTINVIDDITSALCSLGTIGLIGGAGLGLKNIGRPKMFGLVLKYADNHMCSLGY